MKKEIKVTFTDTLGIPKEYYPKPASKYIPEWYSQMNSYFNDKKIPDGLGGTTATIKRCMPVFDAINSGYIISTPCDVWVRQGLVTENEKEINKNLENLDSDDKNLNINLKQPYYEWSNFNIIEFHPIKQAPTHPNNTGHIVAYPKWTNPWSIKTPPGYSVAFVQPWHRESIFTILPGIVDTDNYTAPVNFPFVLNDINFEGLIPAGTPIAQIIPFKRDSWKMEIGKEEDLINQKKISVLLKSKFFDAYKIFFRQKKEYK
jgi:hypothetical protein